MKQTVLYPALSAILSGLILSAVGFFIFTRNPTDLTRQVSISYYNTDFNTQAIKDIVSKVIPDTKLDKDPALHQIYTNFGFGNSVSLSIYKIENHGDYEVPKIMINLRDFQVAYLTKDKEFIKIEKGNNETFTSLLPNSDATLLVFSQYVNYTSPNKFLIDGKNVPVLSISTDVIDDVTDDGYLFFRNYLYVIFWLCLSGAVTLFLMLTSLIFWVFTRNNTEFQIATVENSTISKHLTLLNIMRRDSPDRFEKIVHESERLFAKSSKNSEVNKSSQ